MMKFEIMQGNFHKKTLDICIIIAESVQRALLTEGLAGFADCSAVIDEIDVK